MMEMSTVLGAIGDFDGRFVAVSPGWRSVLGYSPERLIGTPCLTLVHSDDLGKSREQLDGLRASGIETSNCEVRLRARDGSYRWILWNLRGDPAGRRIYGVGYDMTERRLVEEQLIEAREEALESSRAKSRFLANMSHEIRTPMNGILGVTSLLRETTLSPHQRELVETAHQSAHTLLAIIDDVLDISKIEARRVSLRREPFHLHGLIADVMASNRGRAIEKGIAFDAEVDPGLPQWVLGDGGRVAQILRNLVSNALKFTERGQVRVNAGPHEDGVHFAVEDTGPGVDPSLHEVIFEPFLQIDDSATRRHGGTGLGLSISRELATMMGGRLWIVSAQGQGSTFHCVLPLPAATPAAAQTLSPPPPAQLALNLRVLLAEDNPVNARVATLMLRKLGCEVTIADSGAKVLELIRQRRSDFDLILMDVQMPDLDGLTATREIRAEEMHRPTRLGPIPIIALTANAMKGDEPRCREAGMNGYLAKPVTLERLAREVQRVISEPS
jgi:PAS domain S-box-containing protein